MKRKKTYGFSLVLTVRALCLEDCDTLYEAGCDDGTIVTRNGVTFIAGLNGIGEYISEQQFHAGFIGHRLAQS